MDTGNGKLYEAMFLVDSAEAAADWAGVIKTIEELLKKAGTQIVSVRKWDERKLAYEIKRKSRGTYILCYFRADGEHIRTIERDVQLSERLMRVLILSAEAMRPEDIEKETSMSKPEKEVPQAAEQSEATGTDEAEHPSQAPEDEAVADEAAEGN